MKALRRGFETIMILLIMAILMVILLIPALIVATYQFFKKYRFAYMLKRSLHHS